MENETEKISVTERFFQKEREIEKLKFLNKTLYMTSLDEEKILQKELKLKKNHATESIYYEIFFPNQDEMNEFKLFAQNSISNIRFKDKILTYDHKKCVKNSKHVSTMHNSNIKKIINSKLIFSHKSESMLKRWIILLKWNIKKLNI